MEVLYIPQLDEVDATGETTATRYRLYAKTPEDGVVGLADKAVNKIAVTDETALRLVVPPLVKGQVRDFFVRLVITADAAPEITFAAPTGEIISFEDIDEDVLKCEIGINVFSFTENDEGVFFVNRKVMDIDHDVEFDPNEGVLSKTTYTFQLGAQYATLPKPTRTGYVFKGWYTEVEGGIEVTASDTVKTGVSKLYAHWEVYVDPFVDAICPAKDMTFFSESEMPWLKDEEVYVTEPASARSGAIADDGSTSLTATVAGAGTIAFKWRTSSEGYYDLLHFYVDGEEIASISGERDWEDFSHEIGSGGSHALEWRYTKDSSCSSGSDCAWIDEVVWTPTGA